MAERPGVYQVWHKNGEEFVHVADVKAGNLLAALVFTMKLKNPSWQDHSQVTAFVDNARPTTLGDRVVDPDGTAYSIHEFKGLGVGFKEIPIGLDAKEHGHTTLESLFKEWRDDYAAGKREDAHMVQMGSLKDILDGKKETAPVEKEQDKDIER